MGDFLSFVKAQSIDGNKADLKALSHEWRQANAHIKNLEVAEAGFADNPSIEPVAKSLARQVDALQSDPIFQRSFFLVPVELGMVELDRLIVFQKEINVTHVKRVQEELGRNPTEADVFRFCLPYDHPQPPVRHFQIAANAYAFVSPSNDLRILDVTGHEGNAIAGYSPSGPVAGVLAFVAGYGSNFVNVLKHQNRLVLNNGSHRAYALREMGIKKVPAIIQNVATREELEALGAGDVALRADTYFKSPRPPLLKDYFDPALRRHLLLPKKVRQVRISFAIESLDLPDA